MNRNRILLAALALAALGALAVPAVRRHLAGHDHARPAQAALYYCPMHPQVTSDRPGECPVCHMTLVPVERPGEAEQADAPGQPVPGQATVLVTPERRQLIGVRTGKVERRRLFKIVRAPGRVAHDPDLYNAMAEYWEAVRSRRNVAAGALPDVRERADALVRAAELKLSLQGVSPEDIAEVARATATPTGLLVPGHGARTWLYLQVYQHEVGLIRTGQRVRATSTAMPGRVFEGVVRTVDPLLDPMTRSLRVRVELDEGGAHVAHEVFMDAEVSVALGESLAVPEEAVLDTGTRQLVFVDLGDGRFEPREVRLGHQAEGWFQVLGGLAEGETVVTSAQFLIDSESKIKAALDAAKPGAGGHGH